MQLSRGRRRTGTAMAVLLLACSGALAGQAPGSYSVVLEPTADATLYAQSGAIANGAGEFLFSGRILDGSRRRALLRFDVAGAVPAGATVTAATLQLSVTRTTSGEVPMHLHRVLADWGEGASDAGDPGGQGVLAEAGDATWTLRFYPGDPWSSPGGDYVAEPSATAQVGADRHAWSGPQLAADVQAWLDAPQQQFGWALVADESLPGPTAKRFASRENSDAAARPLLTIDYAVGAGPAPAPIAQPLVVPALDKEVQGTLAALVALVALLVLRRR